MKKITLLIAGLALLSLPILAPVYLARGKFYKHQGRLDLADSDFNQARALDPGLAKNQ